jgi:hypothetical protein
VLALLFAVASSTAGAGTIGSDSRLAIADYAKAHNTEELAARKLFAASGRIMCPFNAASAFLVYRNDIVLTARHVVMPEPSMNFYAFNSRPGSCSFEVSTDGVTSTWYEADMKAVIYPESKQRSFTDRFDWIVMKLVKPIPDIVPYGLADAAPTTDEDVTMVTLRQEDFQVDWNERVVEDCKIKKVIDIDAIADSGLKLDCSADHGSSGGVVARRGPQGLEAVGIQSSMSIGACPKFNATTCYSFAVGISEDVKKAIRTLAGEP